MAKTSTKTTPGTLPKATLNMRDVAAAAGVSVTTVSRVLNDNAIPTQTTRQRVLEVVTRMGYTIPASRQRATTSKKTSRPRKTSTHAPRQTRAVVLLTHTDVEADVQGDFDQHEQLVGCMHQAFDAVDCRMYYVKWNPQADPLPDVLDDPQVIGAVVHCRTNEQQGRLLCERLPVVFLDQPQFDQAGDVAVCSVSHSQRASLRYLMELGHQRVVMFIAEHQRYYEEAFLAESARLELPMTPAMRRLCQPRPINDETYHDVLSAYLTELADLGDERPTAVMAWSRFALGLVENAQRRQWDVPADLSVLGISDRLLHYMHPPITAYDWPMDELGRIAAELLMQRVEQPHRAYRHVAVRGRVIERASCATLAPGSIPGSIASKNAGNAPAAPKG